MDVGLFGGDFFRVSTTWTEESESEEESSLEVLDVLWFFLSRLVMFLSRLKFTEEDDSEDDVGGSSDFAVLFHGGRLVG